VRGLGRAPLPLFAAAAVREVEEPAARLEPLTAGGEVVADYGHVGLSLRRHPVAFLRESLARRRVATCAEVARARDGRWLETAGLVLVRQRPGSAKGVLFVTLEDETGIANLVVWPQTFERNRPVLLAAHMLAVRGRIQREGEVVHLVAQHFADLSAELASIDRRELAFPLPHGRGDQIRHGGAGPDRDPRDAPPLRVRTRDFH